MNREREALMASVIKKASNVRGESRFSGLLERTFRPNYLSFAGTYQCNLACPHCCVPIEWEDRLDTSVAIRFLEDARQNGIEVLGFTGGEPFVYPEFVWALTERASKLGFRFDKVMTNGVWFENLVQLQDVLTRLRDCGFSGKIGLSIDKFHGIHTDKLSDFCRVTREIFDRDNILSLSYASASPDKGLEPIQKLAKDLDAILDWSALLNRYLLVSPDFTMTLNWNHLAQVERAEQLPSSPWDGEWFEEDYCEGPGQALIITPKGDVKPCCGFASDLDQLTIGNIYHHSVSEVIENGRNHPYVGKVFREGLTSIRDEILARNPSELPHATSNHCYFCWYVLTRGLALGMSGGGGQIGNWTGTRPNVQGNLIELGLPSRTKQP
jgi:MoaA/NifB/PqqE/SkfB family radical SAM enzyme